MSVPICIHVVCVYFNFGSSRPEGHTSLQQLQMDPRALLAAPFRPRMGWRHQHQVTLFAWTLYTCQELLKRVERTQELKTSPKLASKVYWFFRAPSSTRRTRLESKPVLPKIVWARGRSTMGALSIRCEALCARHCETHQHICTCVVTIYGCLSMGVQGACDSYETTWVWVYGIALYLCLTWSEESIGGSVNTYVEGCPQGQLVLVWACMVLYISSKEKMHSKQVPINTIYTGSKQVPNRFFTNTCPRYI